MQLVVPCLSVWSRSCGGLGLLLQELRELQRDGHSLDELWQVARGQPKYQDFMSSKQPLRSNGKHAGNLQLPEDLVGLDEIASLLQPETLRGASKLSAAWHCTVHWQTAVGMLAATSGFQQHPES